MHVDHEKEWRQHTPLSESNTNGERSWFNSPDTDTNVWAGMQWLDSTAWKALGTPKHFSWNPVACFLEEVDKACVDVFATLPRFHKNVLESENLVCGAMAGTRIIQFWFSYFAASFFKALGNVNVNCLKIPKKHRGPHKTPWWAASKQSCICMTYSVCTKCVFAKTKLQLIITTALH